MSQWYLSYDGSQMGPMEIDQALLHVRKNSNGYAWQEGFASWIPIPQIQEFQDSAPAMPLTPSGTWDKADAINYKIFGSEMQYVEIELNPGESAVAEAGAMMYKDESIQMETIFGDGSGVGTGGTFMDKLMGAGKRLLTGATLFMTVFTHTGTGKAHVAFGAPFPGNIIPIKLTDIGGCLICQKDSYLCAARGVAISIYFQRKILTGLFGGDGFIMQQLEGTGLVFMHAGGTVMERQLANGEVIHVDTGCIAGFEPSVQFDIQQTGGIITALFGGEGFFFARLQGPGRIWLQSLPFSRLAGRMLRAAPQRVGNKEEGFSLGNLIENDL